MQCKCDESRSFCDYVPRSCDLPLLAVYLPQEASQLRDTDLAESEIRAVIADPEKLARQRLRRLLAREKDIAVVSECASGPRALEAVRELEPDVLFLEVQLPGLDGLGVVRSLDASGAEVPLLVFVTAYTQYAVKAFELNAVDYIVKPVDPDRLREAVARVRARLPSESGEPRQSAYPVGSPEVQLPPDTEDPPVEPRPERLMVRSEGKLILVKLESIDWIQSAGNYAKLHAGKEVYTIRCTMTQLERMLDPRRFARIHRSTIVNFDRIKELQPWFSGDWLVILQDGTRLRLSRFYRSAFQSRLAS